MTQQTIDRETAKALLSPDAFAKWEREQDTRYRFLRLFDADPCTRPLGSNADEWHLFLSTHLDNRASRPTGLTFMAVQIAEAIEDAERRGSKCTDGEASPK